MEDIRLALAEYPDIVLWRNQGGATEIKGQWQRYGLVAGASDLIGIVTTKDGVGRFFACEVKAPGRKETEEQRLFRRLVNKFGGFAFVAENVCEAEQGYFQARSGSSGPTR